MNHRIVLRGEGVEISDPLLSSAVNGLHEFMEHKQTYFGPLGTVSTAEPVGSALLYQAPFQIYSLSLLHFCHSDI